LRSRALYRLANSSLFTQAAAIVAILIVLVGIFEADTYFFGGGKPHVITRAVAARPSPSPSVSPSPVASPTPDSPVPIPVSSTVAVAQANVVQAYASPSTRSKLVANIPHHNLIGQETPFLVVASQPGWYQAYLPVKPNDTEGWLQASQVMITSVNDFILADLSTFSLKHYVSGKLVSSYSIAVGEPNTPTPTGNFYVWAIQTNPGPPYTPVIFALSAFSTTLTNWPDGGIVGIHGWADTSVEGKAASNGCMRMKPGDAMDLLNSQLPLGTPVDVVA
jgi:lipoprotein-anchoring transpeptidase ErfK/SrfK